MTEGVLGFLDQPATETETETEKEQNASNLQKAVLRVPVRTLINHLLCRDTDSEFSFFLFFSAMLSAFYKFFLIGFMNFAPKKSLLYS